MTPLARLILLGLLLVASVEPVRTPAQSDNPDPRDGEVALAADAGWHAALVLDNGGQGVWAVRALSLFAKYGCPQLIALDDAGRCTILVSYSGKWTPWQTVHDGQWLGAAALANLDAVSPDPELYVGGQRGRVYRIDPKPGGGVETRIAFDLPGEEVHTLLGGDLDPNRPGHELLGFTRSGRVELVHHHDGTCTHTEIHRLPGRVRNALVLPQSGGEAPRIVTVSRPGFVRILRFANGTLESTVIHRAPMGFGRVTRRPGPGPNVLYVTRDDGVVVRLEETDDGWRAEDVYAGPLGLRGVAAGRFHDDPARESIAVFGYGSKVQLVSRAPGEAWRVETIFRDKDRGHDLIAVELDGRNGTTELVGSGYSGRVFMLKRPPGYAHAVAVDPDPAKRPDATSADNAREPVRIAVAASSTPVSKLTTLDYGGGFETKTFIYDTLLRRDEAGRIAPGLAESWTADGPRLRLRLRPGLRFHDGSPLDANAVREHVERWLADPAHRWIGASRRIQRVEVHGSHELTFHLDRPYALAADLCATNPCGIVGPGAFGRDGDFERPIGTGRYAFQSASENFDRLRYAAFDQATGKTAPDAIELVRIGHPTRVDPVELLRQGEVDVIVDSWLTRIPREHIAALRENPDLVVHTGKGSAVRYLAFNTETMPRALRSRVREAIDRSVLIFAAEKGFADPCGAWVAPTVVDWPRSRGRGNINDFSPPDVAKAPVDRTLRVLASTKFPEDAPLADALAQQLRSDGIAVTVRVADRADDHPRRLGAGDYDIRIERSWGVPYDPFTTLVSRFGTPDPGVDPRLPVREGSPELTRLVDAMAAEPDDRRRVAFFGEIQALVDREALVVPLFVPHRIAVMRRGIADIFLTHDIVRSDVRVP